MRLFVFDWLNKSILNVLPYSHFVFVLPQARVFTTVIVLLEEKSAHQRGFLNDLLKLKKKQKRKEILL